MKYIWITVVFLSTAAVVLFGPPEYSTGQSEVVYIGNDGCLPACHKIQTESFAKNVHNNAYTVLAASELFRTSKEKGTESQCYRCHTTGYGRPGGFTDFETTPQLAKVGCEGCHGPGSVHAALNASDIAGKKAAIDRKPDCGGCHLIHSHTDD